MIDLAHLVRFIIASAAIILVPGPSIMFVIARAIAWGRRTALLTVLGNALGMFVLAMVVAGGLGPILQSSKFLLVGLQVVGGLYLIYLGYEAFSHRREQAQIIATVTEDKPSTMRNLQQGFMVGLLNPKAIVFIGAIFPQFLDPDGAAVTLQLTFFGVLWCILAILGDGMWALIVGSSRDWFVNSQTRLVTLRTVGAGVMVVLGLGILIPEMLRIFGK